MIFLGIVFVAVVATVADYLWFEYDVRHHFALGILHGAVLLMAVGGVIGRAAGRTAMGLPLGAAAGVGGALAYYALASFIGNFAMLAAWAIVWLLLAVGEGRLLRTGRRSWTEVLTRGVLAALLSGVAFYAMLDVLWGRPPAGGRNYLLQLAAWAIAWAPGILAIGIGGKGSVPDSRKPGLTHRDTGVCP